MSLPSMQTLRAFDAAARHGSYSQAALELGVTHGAISHRIRELEERFGVDLFRRSGRSMVPTREALALLSHIRQGLDALHRAFPEPPRSEAGHLVISAHPAFAYGWLAPNLGDFTARHPEIDLEVRSTADLHDFLDTGVDVAVRYGAGGWPNVSEERLTGDVLFPVCAPSYRAQLGVEAPRDLARCTLLRHTWQTWSPWFREAGLRLPEPTSGVRFSDNALALAAAAAGQGVTLARGLLAMRSLQLGSLIRLFEVSLKDDAAFYIVWRGGAPLSPAAELFRGWVREALRQSAVHAARVDPMLLGKLKDLSD